MFKKKDKRQGWFVTKRTNKSVPSSSAKIIEKERDGITQTIQLEPTERQMEKVELGQFDYILREGNYHELVRKVLNEKGSEPELVVAVFQQIRIRQELDYALANHEHKDLLNLFVFLRKHLLESTFFDILYDVGLKAIELYSLKTLPTDVLKIVKWFNKIIQKEIALQKQLCRTLGIVEMIVSWNKIISKSNSKHNAGIVDNGGEEDEDVEMERFEIVPNFSLENQNDSNGRNAIEVGEDDEDMSSESSSSTSSA